MRKPLFQRSSATFAQSRRCCAFAAGAALTFLLLGCTILRADDAPAHPEFCCTTDPQITIVNPLLIAQFGTFRVGAPGVTLNFSVYNRPANTGTTSPMSLVGTQPFGDTSSISLQTGTIVGLPAGGQSPMQLSLSTSVPSPPGRPTEASYTLTFQSDSLGPTAPKPQLSIAAYATILRRGDYDSDGDVDNADYGIWRSTFGSTNPAADGNENGRVDAADFVVWRNNYTGPLSASAAGSTLELSMTVPEPASVLLALLGAGSLGVFTRSRKHRIS